MPFFSWRVNKERMRMRKNISLNLNVKTSSTLNSSNMKKKSPLVLVCVSVVSLYLTGCNAVDPDVANAKKNHAANDVQYTESDQWSQTELLNSLTDEIDGWQEEAGIEQGSTSQQAWRSFADDAGNGEILNVYLTDLVGSADMYNHYISVAASTYTDGGSYNEQVAQVKSAAESLTQLSGVGGAYEMASYSFSSLTSSPASDPAAVDMTTYDVDFSYLENVDVMGWRYYNSASKVTKLLLGINGRFGLVIETGGTNDFGKAIEASIRVVEALDSYIAQKQS